jgi:hypothetical protein
VPDAPATLAYAHSDMARHDCALWRRALIGMLVVVSFDAASRIVQFLPVPRAIVSPSLLLEAFSQATVAARLSLALQLTVGPLAIAMTIVLAVSLLRRRTAHAVPLVAATTIGVFAAEVFARRWDSIVSADASLSAQSIVFACAFLLFDSAFPMLLLVGFAAGRDPIRLHGRWRPFLRWLLVGMSLWSAYVLCRSLIQWEPLAPDDDAFTQVWRSLPMGVATVLLLPAMPAVAVTAILNRRRWMAASVLMLVTKDLIFGVARSVALVAAYHAGGGTGLHPLIVSNTLSLGGEIAAHLLIAWLLLAMPDADERAGEPVTPPHSTGT